MRNILDDFQVQRVISTDHYIEPASWETKRYEHDLAYRAEYRLARLPSIAKRATEAVIEVHNHINAQGPLHPAAEAECRRLEAVAARIAEELMIDWLRR